MNRLSTFRYLNIFRLSTAAALMLVYNALQAEDFLVTDFKNKDAVPPIWEMWGGAATTFTWHADDADGDANSGSLKLTLGFDRELDDNQYAIGMALGGKEDWNKDVLKSAEKYAKLALDIRWVGPGRGRKSTRPGANGVVELTPFEFLDRLADLVPPPRKHRHRYHGVFAPNHSLRPAVTSLAIGNVGKRQEAETTGRSVSE